MSMMTMSMMPMMTMSVMTMPISMMTMMTMSMIKPWEVFSNWERKVLRKAWYVNVLHYRVWDMFYDWDMNWVWFIHWNGVVLYNRNVNMLQNVLDHRNRYVNMLDWNVLYNRNIRISDFSFQNILKVLNATYLMYSFIVSVSMSIFMSMAIRHMRNMATVSTRNNKQ